MPRLRRTSPSQPGWTRRRVGKGFVYLDERGDRIGDPEQVQRLKDLVVPPAWRDVWLCPYPNGHLLAVGTDDAGRRQYLYHPQWSRQRAREKHLHVVRFARELPAARKQVNADLALPGLPRERVLATAFRLLDLGLFRIGGETYAEENGSYGLATLRKEHVRVENGRAMFEYLAKSGKHRTVGIEDADVVDVVQALRRRRGGGAELLAWRDGRGWVDMVSDDVNAYVKQVVMPDASAKDFRTWHATVLAAVALSGRPRPTSATAARRAVAGAMREVSEELGNTPTVCRASYVDPRVVDRFLSGATLDLPGSGRRPVPPHRIEQAVLDLLDG